MPESVPPARVRPQWFDIDYMQNWHDWTFDPANFPLDDVREFVARLHDDGRSVVTIIDPGILAVDPSWGLDYPPYTAGLEQGVFVRDGFTGAPYMSQVWPGPTHFPDWFHPNVSSYWRDSVASFLADVPVDA